MTDREEKIRQLAYKIWRAAKAVFTTIIGCVLKKSTK
jgi:hypothetical protein